MRKPISKWTQDELRNIASNVVQHSCGSSCLSLAIQSFKQGVEFRESHPVSDHVLLSRKEADDIFGLLNDFRVRVEGPGVKAVNEAIELLLSRGVK